MENVQKKINKIKGFRFTGILLILTAVVVLITLLDKENNFIHISMTIAFTILFTKYYFIDPLLGKIEMLENDVKRISQKNGIEHENIIDYKLGFCLILH